MTRVALLDVKPFAENCYTFGGLDYLSDKFAAALNACGIVEGDAVAIVLEQSAALVVAQLGALKLGAVAVLLSPSAAPGDVEYALTDSGAKALVAPFDKRADYAATARRAASINTIFLAGDSRQAIHYEGPEHSFWRDVFVASADFTPAATGAVAPALIFYARTADGGRRRVAHSHAAVLEHLAAFATLNRQDIRDGDALWCGDDWAAADLLLGLVYPAWWYGCMVVTNPPAGLDDESVVRLFQAGEVTAAFLTGGLLEAWRQARANEPAKSAAPLRTVITRGRAREGGEGQPPRDQPGAAPDEVSAMPVSGLVIAEVTTDHSGDDFGDQG